MQFIAQRRKSTFIKRQADDSAGDKGVGKSGSCKDARSKGLNRDSVLNIAFTLTLQHQIIWLTT